MPRTSVTVSPVGLGAGHGTNNGADFGPDTPGTSTQGLAEAIAAGGSAGLAVEVLEGRFVLRNSVTISGPCMLRFCGATLELAPENPGYCLDLNGAHDVLVEGEVRFISSPQARQVCVRLFRASRVTWRAKTSVAQVPPGTSWLQALGASDCVFEGPFHSTDSALLHLTDSSRMVVRNVACLYASDPRYNVVRVDSTAGQTYAGISISHCHIDGAGLLDSTDNPYILVASGANPSAHPTDVTISDCVLKNTKPSGTGPGGIVVLNVDRAAISNCTAYQVVFGFALVGSSIVCSNCVAERCWFPGFQLGDSLNQAYDWSDMTLTGCLALDCGSLGDQDYVKAGISVQATKGFTVRRISVVGCTALDRGERKQKFGIAISDSTTSGTAVDVQVVRSRLGGFASPFYDGQSIPVGMATDPWGIVESHARSVVGIDDRSGLTAVDPGPVVVYMVGSHDELLSIQMQALASSLTAGAITYAVTYTDPDGRARGAQVRLEQPVQREAGNLLRCKRRTPIRAQVTSVGTDSRFSVSCVVTKIRDA